MTEHLKPPSMDYWHKKRKKIATMLAASSFLLMGTIDEGGVRLLPSEINLESKSLDEVVDPLLGKAHLLLEPFLDQYESYEFSHRAGNSIESINEAVAKGANIIDMDVTNSGGHLYGEHGIVIKKQILGTEVALVLDVNELEISVSEPTKFEDLIEHIASLNTDEQPIAVNLELKRGSFNPEALEKLVDTLLSHEVPAFIQSSSKEKIDTIREIYDIRNNFTT